jgi:hypothetical protein
MCEIHSKVLPYALLRTSLPYMHMHVCMYRLQAKPNATNSNYVTHECGTALNFKHLRTNTLKLTEEIKRKVCVKLVLFCAAVSKAVCTDWQANDKKELQ